MLFRDLTEEIAYYEGRKREVNIAQINEITRITLTLLADLEPLELFKLLKKYENRDL